MYMVSLNQAAGIAREEMTSLDGITAELLNFIQLKSQRLYMHSLQVANYSVSIAAKLMLPKSEIEQIKYAALLHDVGLLVVSNTLLVKIPYLNRSEMAQYKRHAASGGNMLENIPCCQDIVPYIRYHHEHWDGSGFPQTPARSQYPLRGADHRRGRLLRHDHQPVDRIWAKTKKQAVRELFSSSGLLFDPEVVKAFIEILG